MNKPSNSVLLVIFIVIVLLVVIAFFVKTHRYNGNGGLIGGLGEIFTASSSGVTGAGITQFFAKPGKGGGANDDDALSHAGSEYYGGDSDSDDIFSGGEEDFDTIGDGEDVFNDGGYETEGMGYIYGAGQSIISDSEIVDYIKNKKINAIVIPKLPFTNRIKEGSKITIVKAKPTTGTNKRPYRIGATVVSKSDTDEKDFTKIVEEYSSLNILPDESDATKDMMTELFVKYRDKAEKHVIFELTDIVKKDNNTDDNDGNSDDSAGKKKTRSKTSTAH